MNVVDEVHSKNYPCFVGRFGIIGRCIACLLVSLRGYRIECTCGGSEAGM